ncbi:MAG: 50S ribosomal protein L22 [Holosporales bacterium]|nr:50S ribosomal protein L22 [Holosporales bacterium]
MATHIAKSILKKIRVSPQKLNLVAAMIRGMHTFDALNVLAHCKKRIAVDVSKALKSAVANAEMNHSLDPDLLYVKEAYVGYSLKLRRYRPRGRGKGEVITKPFSNLTVVVEERS